MQIKQTNLHVKDVIIGVIYRPPNTDFDIFHTNFSNILTSIDLEKRPTYLLGDFNIDLLKHGSDSRAQLFLNNLLSNGFYPRIDKPTRLTNTTATLIDNIFVNVHSDDIVSGPWLTDISDHLPIYTTFPYEFNSVEKSIKYITKRIYDDKNIDSFKNELMSIDWSDIYAENNVNSKFSLFMQIFHNLHDKYFPLTRFKIRNNGSFKPWISRAIKNSIKRKKRIV